MLRLNEEAARRLRARTSCTSYRTQTHLFGKPGALEEVAPAGQARQDRRPQAGEPVGSRVAPEALATAGADRLVMDPHTTALEIMSPVPVEVLTAVPVVAAVLAEDLHNCLRLVLVTDTLATPRRPRRRRRNPPLQVRSVAQLLADAIARLHSDRPLDTLLMPS
ncbi:hypothetical protein ACIBU0_04515 [Streptomyces sp. NPDC049627]|uniref:hypothetical protein n=1 Tax=Streptomyces sp. NPDC049627 TaxID=3365595 RepID=UPI0037BAE0FF